MMDALQDVNTHSFNNFKMRIGISSGPLVGGVIGAKKPVYDIWGNTVNEASRMDSTGSLDKVQVPKDTAEILKKVGYHLDYRGLIQVKGKGQMETYWVSGKISRQSSLNKSQHGVKKSIVEVIGGMVEVRRKQALESSFSVPTSIRISKLAGDSSSILASNDNNNTGNNNNNINNLTLLPMEPLGTGYIKKHGKMSASFRFRKSPSPHTNRMMSDLSTRKGRSKSFYVKNKQTKINDT